MHLAESLNAISDPASGPQLERLDEIVGDAIPSECGEAEFRALLGVFERFPEENGHGVFWSIVHFLEKCEHYEAELLNSVQRKPCEFNLLMVNRQINSGVTCIAGQSLASVLAGVAANPAVSESARGWAQGFIEHQNERVAREA